MPMLLLPRSIAVAVVATSLGCAARTCPPTAAPAPTASHACTVPTGPLSATFAPDTRLPGLVAWATAFTCKAFVYDPTVADRAATIVAPGELNAEAAYQVFTGALATMNLRAEAAGDVVRLVAIGPAPARIAPPAAAPLDDAAVAELAAALDAGITRVDDSTFAIDRALVDRLLANPMAVSKGARLVPSVKNGVPNGFKIYAVRPTSIYARLGLVNGDTIHAVNGHALASVDEALEVYAKVRTADHLELDVTRRGRPVTLRYTIK